MDSWKHVMDIPSYSEIKTIFLLLLPILYTILRFWVNPRPMAEPRKGQKLAKNPNKRHSAK